MLTHKESKAVELALLSPAEVGEILGKSEVALACDRANGRGPAFAKIGRRVMYRPEDVRDYIEANVIRPKGGPHVDQSTRDNLADGQLPDADLVGGDE